MEDIFEISSCTEILANDIKVDTTALQLTKNHKVYTVWDLHPFRGKSGTDKLKYDQCCNDYKAFVPSNLTEFQNV